MQLCSCRSLKRKRGFGHLLFFRNPCRGRNLLNNNVTFIQWDMTFKNKGQWRVSLLCSVAQIQNTEFELNVTPSAFVSSGPFVVIATTLPPLANPFWTCTISQHNNREQNIKSKNHSNNIISWLLFIIIIQRADLLHSQLFAKIKFHAPKTALTICT